MQSLFPDDVTKPIKPPRVQGRPKGGRSQYRRRAWEDHIRPQVYATDLVEPPAPIPKIEECVEVPVAVLKDRDADLAPFLAAYQSKRALVYAARYAARVPLTLPTDPTPAPDYPGSITALARAYREEMLAADFVRCAAHGVYPVHKNNPGGRWRAQIWIPAQKASAGTPARPGYHKNLRLEGSTHLNSEAEAWLAVAKYYEEVEGIDVAVDPPVGSCMAELVALLREAVYAASDASQAACDEAEACAG